METVLKDDLCFISVRVPKIFERQLRVKAAELGLSRSEFARRALENELKQSDQRQGVKNVKA